MSNHPITAPAVPPEELTRVLEVLLHDVRTPLSVASGYVRLLRDGRLSTTEALDRALNHTALALTRIAHLCDEAVGFLPEGAGIPIGLATLVAHVRRHLKEAGLELACDLDLAPSDPRRLSRGGSVERVASAITSVLAFQDGPQAEEPVTCAVHDNELSFTLGKRSDDEQPFDPWSTSGLTVPLACHTIALAGGRVSAVAQAPGSITIRFSIEGPTE